MLSSLFLAIIEHIVLIWYISSEMHSMRVIDCLLVRVPEDPGKILALLLTTYVILEKSFSFWGP